MIIISSVTPTVEGQAMQHHADAVVDKHDVTMYVDQPGHRLRIGGETDKRRSPLAFATCGGVTGKVLPFAPNGILLDVRLVC
jgi:hypothetical protein